MPSFYLPPPPKVEDAVLWRWLQDVWKFVGGESAAPVLPTLFDANTILKADTDNDPEALTVAEGTLVGRATGGEIAALTAAQARTLLSLVPGTDVQAFDADLTALGGISGVNGDIIIRSSGAWTRLGIGSAGQVLRVASSLPSWATGSVVSPSYFFARHETVTDDQTNVTGNGGDVNPTYSDVEYNVGSDFNNATATYTAPVDGIYGFSVAARADNGGGGQKFMDLFFEHSRYSTITTATGGTTGAICQQTYSICVHMAEADTLQFVWQVVGNGSDGMDVNLAAFNWAMGALLVEV